MGKDKSTIEKYGIKYSLILYENKGNIMAETYCYTALKQARKEFGIVPGVTDRDYFTNSSHVPVYYPITIAEKAKIEGKYHSLENAG